MTMANLQGSYELLKSNLVREGADWSLVIGRRQKPTPKKPLHYLLYRSKAGKHTYISSLFPKGQDGVLNDSETYSLDLDGIYYILTLDRDKGTGSIIARNSTNPINNVELGTKFVPKW
jgi:hypothetical protein